MYDSAHALTSDEPADAMEQMMQQKNACQPYVYACYVLPAAMQLSQPAGCTDWCLDLPDTLRRSDK